MSEQKYLDDLHDIREMMNRSLKFMSLSGISGVIVGLIALGAATLAYLMVFRGQDYLSYHSTVVDGTSIRVLFILGIVTLVLSLFTTVLFTLIKARREKQKLWDQRTFRLLPHFFIPLVAGGILILILLFHGFVSLMAPLTLLFYGLALVNASKYSLTELKSLGISQIVLGLLAAWLVGYGLIFWAVGFGVLHIVYGIVMHFRYGL